MTLSKIELLKKQREQLTTRIQKLEASEKARQRKKDTRRKILIGAYYLDKAKEDNTYHQLVQIMNVYLTRKSDRALFDLMTEEQDVRET